MANYNYKAMTKSGKKIEGTYSASSKEEVLIMMRNNNYYPLKIDEIAEKNKSQFKFGKKVKTKDISVFCRQFYTMINAGTNITTTLNILGQQLTNKRLRESIVVVEEDIRKGLTLSEAMKKQKVFPDLLVNMVESGEVSGKLDVIMNRMSEHYERENKLNNKIKSAMMYPIILIIFAIGIITMILALIMPMFVGMFQGSNVDLPPSTKLLLGISNVIKTKWYLIILLVFIIIFALKNYFNTQKGRSALDGIKLKVPFIKKFNKTIITSRFTRTLSIVLYSGVNLSQGLLVVSKVVGNKVVEERILYIREQVMKGIVLSELIRSTEFFPPMLGSMIKIGEESGSLDEILSRTADFYDEEMETAIQQFTAVLEPLMIMIVGSIIGFMIVAIVLPIFTMYNTVQ